MCSSCEPCVPAPPPNPVLTPAAMCCMVVPPPICPPTFPQPVRPLMMPTPKSAAPEYPNLTEDQSVFIRYSNFYNNWNEDYHTVSPCLKAPKCDPGVAACGPPKYCEDYRRRKNRPLPEEAGCPTGFKPVYLKMIPPSDNHPCGVWCAEVQSCPKKPRPSSFYRPLPCKKPGCKHKPSAPRCMYDLPCKATCFNHIPGVHPCNPWLD